MSADDLEHEWQMNEKVSKVLLIYLYKFWDGAQKCSWTIKYNYVAIWYHCISFILH